MASPTMIARAANVAFGHAGAPPRSRCPVRSASSVAAYSRRESHSQPMAVITTARNPNTRARPPMIIEATSTVKPIETSSGRKEGGGM